MSTPEITRRSPDTPCKDLTRDDVSGALLPLSAMLDTMTTPSQDSMQDYRLADGPPSAQDYAQLRESAGLSPVSPEQVAAGLHGAWAAVHMVHDPSGRTVAMGRILSDGGWYFHVVDMAVVPEHQRRGLGGTVLGALLERIREQAAPGAYVNLLADPPGRGLYARHGFVDTAPDGTGMALRLP